MNNLTTGSKIKIFNNEEFGNIRSILIENEPYFVAKDLSKALGYSKLTKMYERIEKEDKKEINPQDKQYQGSLQNGVSLKLEENPNIFKMIVINESGLYDAIFGSRLESAKRFKRWVTSEVLPNIRKNGMYIKEEKLVEMMSQPENLIKILENYNKEKIRNKKLQKEINEVKPKAKRLDNIAGSFNFKDMNSTAKALGVGRNTLMELLRRKKILISKLSNKNQPYEKYIQNGYFTVKVREFADKDGEIKLFYQPMVTNKGLVWLENKINNEWDDEIENKKLKMVNEN